MIFFQELQEVVHVIYARWIRPKLSPLQQQRLKLLWTVWGYWPILAIKTLNITDRYRLLVRLIVVDWNVQHAHWPGEIARVIAAIAERKARSGEVVVEAGCWQGGSTAKFSMICSLLGYKLVIFDSFQGVEYQPGNHFSGQYTAGMNLVISNVSLYGEIEVCEFVPGWFVDTLGGEKPLQYQVRLAY